MFPELTGFLFPNDIHIHWSLMIVMYPYVTGLVAGAFLVSSFYHVFGRQEFKPLSRLALATSKDGINWTKLGKLLSLGNPGAFDGQFMGSLSVIKEDGLIRMWYAGEEGEMTPERIGFAYHPRRSPWRKYDGNPVMMEGPPGAFDEDGVWDPMVIKVAENQWLLYTTARGRYYSLVDIYQSFDLQEWQYIRTALHSGWGSERNSPFASTESRYSLIPAA